MKSILKLINEVRHIITKRGANIAVRSNSIIEARFSLTAKQNELLDMLLCEINDDEQYSYVISVDKYKEFYQSDTSNLYRDLKKAVKSFEGKGFRIINKITNEEIYYAWFSKIHYIPKTGEIRVNIDLDFKKLLCDIKKKIYYDVRYPLNFSSAYSQRMYYYLKSFEDTGWRIDNLDALRYKLECPKSHDKFSEFKRSVLDVAEREINDMSDINFHYDLKKKGRAVVNIKFYIENKEKRIKNKTDNINESTDIIPPLVLQVRSFIEESLSNEDILTLLKTSNNNINIIKETYIAMQQTKNVRNIVGWMVSAITKGLLPTIPHQSKVKYIQTNFNDYEQRSYNYNKLEEKLLGRDNNYELPQ